MGGEGWAWGGCISAPKVQGNECRTAHALQWKRGLQKTDHVEHGRSTKGRLNHMMLQSKPGWGGGGLSFPLYVNSATSRQGRSNSSCLVAVVEAATWYMGAFRCDRRSALA